MPMPTNQTPKTTVARTASEAASASRVILVTHGFAFVRFLWTGHG
jgi:hypothetical protein